MFYIAFPMANTKEISIIEIENGCECRLNDYNLANRRAFYTLWDAYLFSMKMVKVTGITFNCKMYEKEIELLLSVNTLAKDVENFSVKSAVLLMDVMVR